MQLIIKYKNGESRIINLHQEFFTAIDCPPISKRAEDIAYELGKDPYYIGVFRGNDPSFELKILKNMPPEPVYTEPINEKKIKKQLRKEFKHKPLRRISFDELNTF